MKDEILTHPEMCLRHRVSLQAGMNFRQPPQHGIILMSRRPNAPYDDEMSDDESVLIYEGHDARRNEAGDPKVVDQPRTTPAGSLTQNGQFAAAVEKAKRGECEFPIFRVYEKMRVGIWTDRGLYVLRDYAIQQSGLRKVFKFWLEQADHDSSGETADPPHDLPTTRQIPSWVKQEVFKRDKGQCQMCHATDNLHFDHDFPYSKGGTSLTPDNVRILCARHNLQKSDRIE